MIVSTHSDAEKFLLRSQDFLEKHEALNNLILGISLWLKRSPDALKTTAYFGTVEEAGEVIVAAARTPPENLIVAGPPSLGTPAEAAIRQLAESLVGGGAPLPGVIGPSALSKCFAEMWKLLSGRSYRVNMLERVYELRQVNELHLPPGRLRPAVIDDLPLVTEWVTNFNEDALHGVPMIPSAPELARDAIESERLFVWEDENAELVSMAAWSRPTRHGVAINLVYTPPGRRRRGYATACVATLSGKLLSSGREFCTLFTDLANPTSNSIYQKIGYVPVADFDEYRFG